jgi:hypothetical protein
MKQDQWLRPCGSGFAVENLGVMTVQALVETFPWVDIDAQWFLFTICG